MPSWTLGKGQMVQRKQIKGSPKGKGQSYLICHMNLFIFSANAMLSTAEHHMIKANKKYLILFPCKWHYAMSSSLQHTLENFLLIWTELISKWILFPSDFALKPNTLQHSWIQKEAKSNWQSKHFIKYWGENVWGKMKFSPHL